ncbi:MAG: cobalt-precorrin-6A reductase [Pikeienuella sp.]
MKILLLGGAGDAPKLAQALMDDGWPVVASLAGTTKRPRPYPCETRIGGFGGAAQLAAWVVNNQVGAIIDATHPFAVRISAHAVWASRECDIPIMAVERPPWTPEPGDDWHSYSNIQNAILALPPAARAFMTIGRGGLEAATIRDDVWTALRVVDEPDTAYPGNGKFVAARPPFDAEAEKNWLSENNITHLVAKNSGGEAGRAKLDAARALGIPVFMIERKIQPDVAPSMPANLIPNWLDATIRKPV